MSFDINIYLYINFYPTVLLALCNTNKNQKTLHRLFIVSSVGYQTHI